jgi:hypothetical protein
MIGRVISFVFIPVFIWMLIASYKEVKRNYDISGDSDFLFKIFWLFAVAYGTLSLFLYSIFNASIVFKLKYW